jgi:hypothetical protein
MLGFLRSVTAASVIGLLLVTACSDPPDDGEELCTSTGAPYQLLVTVPEGSVPSDLTLQVQYGGGSETFELADPADVHQVLFCNFDHEEIPGLGGQGGQGGQGGASAAELHRGGPGGANDSGVEKVTCDVYAESAVSLTVTGVGYEPLRVELEPEVDDECGVVSKLVPLELVPESPVEEP